MKWHTILAMGEAHYIELQDKQKASKAVINLVQSAIAFKPNGL